MKSYTDLEQSKKLAESEDERIRKALINKIKCLDEEESKEGYSFYAGDYTANDCIAWLEKQGEQKSIDPDTIIQQRVDALADIVAEQEPADKVEPKFHKGEWIVFNGLTLYVKEVVKGFYKTISKGSITNSYDWDIDNAARLWTIQDAKDGDVVVCGDFGYTSIMLFKSFSNDRISLHCWYNSQTDGFHVGAGVALGKNASVYPATKEQRDTLMKAMADDGYEWDADKKELKRIEQKPVEWSEEDDKMINSIAVHLNAATGGFPEDRAWADKFMIWLKSLKDRCLPQPKQEWSKEDEGFFKTALWHISYSISNGKSTDIYCDTTEWFKSLKERIQHQSHWKPSEEQMTALSYAIINTSVDSEAHSKTEILKELYEQLKAL